MRTLALMVTLVAACAATALAQDKTQLTVSTKGGAGAISVTLPALPNQVTYLCGFSMTSGGSKKEQTGDATVTGIEPPLAFAYVSGPGKQGNLDKSWLPCLAARDVNTPIVVTQPAGGPGTKSALSAWGYQMEVDTMPPPEPEPSPDDGSANAPAGVAQAPGLFTNAQPGAAGINYTATGGVRPPWKVAGVDYRTGYDTTLTLADPTTFVFPACASADKTRRILTVNSPCVIEGVDFAKDGGWIARVADACSGGVVMFRNNNFVMGTNHGNAGALSLIYVLAGSTCDLTLEKNIIDGNVCVHNGANSIGALVSSNIKTRNTKVLYNQFLNSPQHGVALNYNSTNTGNFTSRYNYYRSMGNHNTTNNHADPFIFNNLGGTYDITVEYDTYVQSSTGGDFTVVGTCPANKPFVQGTGGVSALLYFDINNTAAANIVRANHNTLIAEPLQQGGTLWISYMVRAGSASNALGPIADGEFRLNYIDPGVGSSYGVYAMSQLRGVFKVLENISLRNGGPCNSNIQGGGCGP